MPKAGADFTAILDEAFRAEAAGVFMPKLISALVIIVVCLLAAWLGYRFLRQRNVILPKPVLLALVLIFGGMVVVQGLAIRRARIARAVAVARIPDEVQQANGLLQRLLADSTGTAVPTESGTYLALAGDQIFLPKPVAEALQKALTAQNLRLP